MIADKFNPRTRANMDAALDRACALLPAGAEQHDNRRYIASRILKRAERGDVTLSELTEAGERAAQELCERLTRPKPSRAKAHKRGSVSPLQRNIE